MGKIGLYDQLKHARRIKFKLSVVIVYENRFLWFSYYNCRSTFQVAPFIYSIYFLLHRMRLTF